MLKKIARFLILASLTLPLWYTPFTYFPANFGKAVFFTALVEALIAIHALRFLFSNPEEKKSFWSTSFSRLDYALLIFFGILIISALFGVNPANSWWGNQARATGVWVWLHCLVWYWLAKIYADNKFWSLAFNTVTVTALVAALTAVFPTLLPLAWRPPDSAARVAGIIGNAAFLANYLVLAIGVTAMSVVSATNKGLKWLYVAIGAFLTATLFFTATRGAFIGFGIMTLLVALLVVLKDKAMRRIVLPAVGGFITLILVGVALGQTGWFAKHGYNRLETYFHVSNFFKGTGQTRLLVWQGALKGIATRPTLGYGWGNFDVTFNKYYEPALFNFSFSETVWDKPHNWILEIAVTAGFFGLLAYSGVLFFASGRLYRRSNKAESLNNGLLDKIALGTLWGGLAASLFLFEILPTIQLLFLLLAYTSFTSNTSQTVTPKYWHAILPLANFLSGAYFIFLLVSLYNFHYLPILASNYLRIANASGNAPTWAGRVSAALNTSPIYKNETAVFLAERFIQIDKIGSAATTKDAIGAARQVAGVLESAFTKYPDNPTPAMWAGQLYSILGEEADPANLQDGERVLKAALKLSPRKQDILLLLGRTYLLEKKFTEGIQTIQQAVNADSSVGTSWWFLGLAKVSAGDTAGGLKDIEKGQTLGFNPNRNQKLFLIDLYAQQKEYDNIIRWYNEFIIEDPAHVDWYVKLAATYVAAGRKAEALETVKKAIQIYPPLKPDADKFIKENKLI